MKSEKEQKCRELIPEELEQVTGGNDPRRYTGDGDKRPDSAQGSADNGDETKGPISR